MPIYTTVPATGNAPTHPLFADKGIKMWTAGPLSQVTFACLPTTTEIAYAAYRANIDAFVAATASGNRETTIKPGYSFYNGDVIFPPFSTPPIVFTFKEARTTDFIKSFLEKYAENKVAEEMIAKTKVLVAYNPTPEFIKKISRFVRQTSTSRVDTVEFGACRWIGHIWRVIDNFLKTNTYPAFVDLKPFGIEGHESDVPLATAMDVEADEKATLRAALFKDLKKKVVSPDSDDEGSGDESMEEPSEETVFDENVLAAIKDNVVHAKPSPMPSTFNLGAASAVPNLPGQYFPYFRGMLVGDKTTIRTIISRHFLRLFGPTTDDIRSNYTEFRREIESLTHSDLGIELAHILFGIDICLQTQTRMYVIVDDGKYFGYVLLGARFNIHNGRNWVGPETADELHKHLASIGNHSAAIRSIVSLLAKMKVSDGAKIKEKITSSMMCTPSMLSDCLGSRIWTKEAKDDVEKALRDISWPNMQYKTMNLENIKWAIDMLASPDKALDDDYFFYIPSRGFEASTSRDFRILAGFGPSSFSLKNAKGTTFKIVKPDTTDPANVEVDDGKKKTKAMPHLLLSYKPISVAYQDWQTVKKNRAITIDLRERAQAHRNFLVSGKARDDLWEYLKEKMEKISLSDKKRKREEDGDGKKSGKKQKKDDSSEEEELDDYDELLA